MEYGYALVWLVTYLAVGLAALPVAGRLFAGFRDRGAALAVPVALATLGLVGFLVGHLPGAFGLPAALAGVALLAVVSYRASNGPVDLRRAAAPAALFSLAFLFVVAIRAFDPAASPIGGEKFLDFGLLKSLLRADTLPPEDMWFAGESVKYYYGGHVLVALLADLTFTPARYAYNLALAGFYAAVVTATYGIAATVAADHGVSGRVAGALAAFFVALAANLYTAGQLLVWALPDPLARPLVAALGLPVEEALSWTPTDFYYWPASRVIEGTINEFPLFAWLNGDLHAHMMSTNFLLLAVGLLYAYWRTPEGEVGRRRLLVFGLLPPLGGYVATVNTWSFPSVTLGLAFLTLTFAPADPRTLLPTRLREALPASAPTPGAETDGGTGTARGLLYREVTRSGTALALAVGVLLVAVVWVAPFWFSTASGRPIGTFPPGATLGGLLVVHGGFLAAFVAYLVAVGRDADRSVARAAAVGSGLLVVGGLGLGADAVALVGPVLLSAWLLLRAREDVGFETMLVVAGAGIVLLVEYVYVAEPQYAGTGLDRMNTVFKTYAQVWVLWAPAAGVVLTRLVAAGRDAAPSFGSARTATAGRVLVAFLLVTTGVYAALAVPAHVNAGSPTANEFGPTLDATAFVDVTHPEEAPAIDYIDALDGRPTIVTAAPAGYVWDATGGDGASAPASLTGVPTVAGWFHERQYRSPETYAARVADVETIYTGSAERQRALIERYGVEYVYVGPAERARYGEITIGDLPGLRAVERGGVTIYVVES